MQLSKEQLLDAAQAAGYSRGLVDADLMLVAINAYCAQADARPAGHIPYTRKAMHDGWTRFELRTEYADEAARRLRYAHPEASAPGLSDEFKSDLKALLDSVTGLCYLGRAGEESLAENLEKALTRASAATVAEPSDIERWKHVANEWADMATNGYQWLLNIQDGTSKVDDAIANMKECMQHCRETYDKAFAAQQQAEPKPFVQKWTAAIKSLPMGEQQAEPSDKLDAPAQVGNTIFRKGVEARLVVEAAQRNYQRLHNPTEEDKRIAAGVESIATLRKQIEAEHDAKSPFQREVEKMGNQKEPRHD